MSTKVIDVVMPTVMKDIDTLMLAINGCLEHVIGLRYIFVVCKQHAKLTFITNDKVKYIDETIYPFTFDDIAKFHKKSSRNGWYYQQLLKLYAYKTIDDISENILIVDSDTIFLKNVNFFDGEIALYNTGTEYNIPYFNHMNKLHPTLHKLYPEYSGICHHMLFQKSTLDELFKLIEDYHKCSLWEAFLKCVDEADYLGSGASEYEIYFNYIFINHNDKVKIRQLNWTNISSLPNNAHKKYDYVSAHAYSRGVCNKEYYIC